MKTLLKIALLTLLVYYVPKFCYEKTAGFTLTKISSSLPYNPEWDVANPPFTDVFDQSFSYLGAGGQCYAFVSEDGQYVIKFFKHHLRRLPLWLKVLPLKGSWNIKRSQQKQGRLKKLRRDFASYKLAIEELPKETGLLFVHLNKTTNLKKQAHVVDKIGIEHLIDLDKTEFILQKRATLAYPHIQTLVEKGDLDGARASIESICSLVIARSKKGIYDEDAKIHRNFGFLGNQAILIDVGRLKRDERRLDPDVYNIDLRKITGRLNDFLAELNPELSEHLQHCLEAK